MVNLFSAKVEAMGEALNVAEFRSIMEICCQLYLEVLQTCQVFLYLFINCER